MKTTSEAYSQIGLHDARILRIVRTDDAIELSLDGAALIQGHPGNALTGDHLLCDSPVLRLVGVSKESARAWDDERGEWTEHDDPTCPIDDEIMEAKRETDHFFFDGFHAEKWSEWRIWATGFCLSWETDHPYHREQD